MGVLEQTDDRIQEIEFLPAVGGWLALAVLRWGVRIGVRGESKEEALILLRDAVDAWERLREDV